MQQTYLIQRGFTLIEMTLVIVMLIVLSSAALPKFIDLQNDTRATTLKSLRGSLIEATNIAYAKAAIDGVEKLARSSPEGDHNTEGDDPYSETNIGALELKYGYPEAHAEDGGIDIIDHLHLISSDKQDSDWDICYVHNHSCSSSGRGKGFVLVGYGLEENIDRACYVKYEEPEVKTTGNNTKPKPEITIDTSEY